MHDRLEQLSWRTQPVAHKNGDYGEVVEGPDSKVLKI